MRKLPERPDFGQLRRQAKELHARAAAGDSAAVELLSGVSTRVSLASAQLALARAYGFPSWARLRAAVESGQDTEAVVTPLAEGKHLHTAIWGPEDALGGVRKRGWSPGRLPVGVVFTAASFITSWLSDRPERFRLSPELVPLNGRMFLTPPPVVGIACVGNGAPAVVTEVEHLVHLGVRRFVTVGPAPALSDELQPGDCLVIEQALRDDGVSQHYLEPARYVAADADLTRELLEAASACGLNACQGRSWTVPTPYRTTAEELIAYREEGIATTELSSAALFAVGLALGAQTASAVIITRVLGESAHNVKNFHQPDAVFRLLEAAIASIQQPAEEPK